VQILGGFDAQLGSPPRSAFVRVELPLVMGLSLLSSMALSVKLCVMERPLSSVFLAQKEK
jgi:hypothetical protein